jgi:predicted ATPase
MPDARAKRDPFRVVITGGPCAGKTEVWRCLGGEFPQGVLVPEAATELILAGKSEESLGLVDFQRAVFERQRKLEEEADKKGRLLICDRGLFDGVAYLPDLLSRVDVSQEDVMSRYAMVIQLEVIRDARAYAAHFSTNPARHEEHERALVLETRIKGIYEKHPDYALLSGSLEDKNEGALRFLRDRLAAIRPDLLPLTSERGLC